MLRLPAVFKCLKSPGALVLVISVALHGGIHTLQQYNVAG